MEERSLADLLSDLELSEFELKRFAYRSQRYYRQFVIDKKSGGKRTIDAPLPELKAVQRRIAKKLLQTHPLHDACNGYRAGKSIVSNAVPHLDKDFVLNIDIKDFFTTISSKRVLGLFCSMGYSEETSYLLARLCTREGALPQGAPSSPDIANLICRRMDHRLSQFCKRREWHYTRYCDDITISGAGSPHASLGTICDIIRSEGFLINDRKLRVRFRHQRQAVTGLVVNQRLALPREKRRRLRAMCHQILSQPESFQGLSERLIGKIAFANMIEDIENVPAFREALELVLIRRRMAKKAGATF